MRLVRLSERHHQVNARSDPAHCIIWAVRRHVQRDALALILLAALPYAARSDWTLGADASVRHDSNVGNAESRPDIAQDSIIGARLSIFQLFPLGESYSLTVAGDLGGESFHRLTGLSNVSVDGTLSLKKKWGIGALAPWARAGLTLGRLSYEDSYRNAWDYRASLASGRRIDERWNLWAEYAFERRAARAQEEEVPGLSGDAFSQDSHNIAINVEYSLSERAFLALGLMGRYGDVVSTASPGPTVFYASQALAEDPALGPDFYAYRLTGTTYGFRVGLSFAPTAHSLLGCGFERFDTHADGGNRYTKSVPEISWDYRF
jgi:hypothetical protein